MADVWSGDILLSDGESIRDIGFSTPHDTSAPAISATTIRFLSTVDTAKIPLYLAVGPSYDVWTTSEASEAWFESTLLSLPTTAASNNGVQNWWTLARAQSPIGVLVQVESQGIEISKPKVTEILIYGTIAAVPGEGLLPELRVHALPLSSGLLHGKIYSSGLPPSPVLSTADETAEIEAQYLAPLYEYQPAPKSPKRKRDLFEEATLARRKAKGKGGVGVAAAAARATESQRPYAHRKSISIELKASPFPESRPSSAHGALPRLTSRQLSRSHSINSDIRPLSRRDTTDGPERRSHLSRVDTISLQPEEPTTESRNKEALTKVVMAAMRMHGLQQRKRVKSRRASTAPGFEESQPAFEELTAEDAAKDEEYKQIYHQTYKGAVLALRQHMTEKPLHAQPDRMRDLVEQFLALFLNDPLAQPLRSDEPTNPATTPGLRQAGIFGSSHHASPFDLPSGMRRPPMVRAQTDGQVYTGSPISKRKSNAHKLDNV
ncbi:uncharacterized protein M421DRAFT_104241 [Didymella exigua CBS 183.55]|uniref:Sld7 C-terminal domain-containing protein n=1 Tax=Didymella exigua CBS 183.55 TaxID=1150837 RepID=A0A6A5R9C9_9PLEO|nr:uncharacterized protein M421DRAFT_104241 [Didymella exigua CBS 183.55]KAF1923798.1 hypothetical protein M421DRAFT_104241 [Didymella exigua CBS 183.55]